MEVKVAHNKFEAELNLSVEINGLGFQVYWKMLGPPGEVCCLQKFEGMTEAELKNLLSSFKEAKAVLQNECNKIEGLIEPYLSYIELTRQKE